MDPKELDAHLEELDNRLERLRALYEQYFLGIEKIEPTIARKDVDRRFWMLRRLQIRNTARRFRLQVLVQRYNTFQQYWARICREIENGTYRRHLLKAEKRFGEIEALTHAARKRRGKRKPAAESEAPPEGRAGAAKRAAEDDLEALLGADFDLEAEAERAATAAAAPKPAAVRAESPKPAAVRAGLDDLDLDFDGFEGPSSVGRHVTAAAARPSPPARPVATPGARPPLPRRAGMPAPPAQPGTPRPPGAPPPDSPRHAPGGTGARPLAARPNRPAAPARANPLAGSGPAPGARPVGGPVSDLRVEQLHAQLIAARQKLNQRGQLSVDGLAKSLRATATKLQAKHGSRSIDFQIVVKDGQAVVRPVVRKPRP